MCKFVTLLTIYVDTNESSKGNSDSAPVSCIHVPPGENGLVVSAILLAWIPGGFSFWITFLSFRERERDRDKYIDI